MFVLFLMLENVFFVSERINFSLGVSRILFGM